MGTGGSGVVRAGIGLDDEALGEVGDPARELRLDDLRESGWTVTGPSKEADGLTWVRLSKPFADSDEAGRVASELSGPDGPFRDFLVERKRTFAKTTTRFTGTVDLSKGLAVLSDTGLEQALGDENVAGLRDRFAKDFDRTLSVRVDVRLPGQTRSWEPKVGEELRLEAASEQWNVRPLIAAVAALVFAVAALSYVVVSRR